MPLPALRPVDAFPIEHQGQQLICLRDVEGYVEEQLVLTPAAFFVACQLDGQHDVVDIQYAYARQFGGQLLYAEEVLKVVHHLDQAGFLYSERFAALRQRVIEAFRQAETRPPYLAGKSYPAQASELRVFLDAFFLRHDGPGRQPVPGNGTPLRGLVAPHIDFHRGGHAYAHGYLRLFQQGPPEVVFIFGVAHAAPPVPFILTQKHFATPFGTLETARELVHHLEAACAWDPYAYEIVHRTEHSIEFQAVMLAYFYGPAVRIVPILCGAFAAEVPVEPQALPEVQAFLAACQELVAGAGKRVSVIAGADLAHVGRRFGDAFDIDARVVRAVEARDREDLQHVTAADAEGFYRSVMRDQNRRRVCGLNCIYAALKALAGSVAGGELVHYDYAPDPAGGIVSFANVALA
ncbi:MAG: MEMO1 family protein [Candidatus Tectimicrobiota bacterium]|nr:MAG: MEMO1 family protein [Candidatus Tectomicrobia bacterium]